VRFLEACFILFSTDWLIMLPALMISQYEHRFLMKDRILL
jgi:hypothetical protein